MSDIANQRRPLLGAGAIALAIGFNAPYALLAATYNYPAILRQPASEALHAFHAGGPDLIWTWYAFGVSALALIPLAIALSLTPARIAQRPGLAVGAAIAGALAGAMQAVGLFRWTFVVPDLARVHADPAESDAARAAAEHTFAVLNAYGGVAIGEHLGQLLTALFVAQLAALQGFERRFVAAALGLLTATAIAAGTGEALALALGRSGDLFSLFTIAGFAGLALWLIATGVGLLRGR
ncbi:MAG: DUF4386 family protein [Alphaproteobacteria bacterium]|nr:DUF4386 family protein [Alphaproteobacteria bacterium]